MASNGRQIHFPALVVLGGFGLGLVLEGDWDFDDAWVSLAFLVWLAHLRGRDGHPPAGRAEAGGRRRRRRAPDRSGGQLVTVLVLVMLYLMIWKPGA